MCCIPAGRMTRTTFFCACDHRLTISGRAPRPATGRLPPCAARKWVAGTGWRTGLRWLAGLQDKEQETQEGGSGGLVLKEVGEQFTGGVWRRGRLTDHGDPEHTGLVVDLPLLSRQVDCALGTTFRPSTPCGVPSASTATSRTNPRRSTTVPDNAGGAVPEAVTLPGLSGDWGYVVLGAAGAIGSQVVRALLGTGAG